MIRIAVVEDHDVVRRGIVSVLSLPGEPVVEVVAEARTLAEALPLADLPLDVVLVDLGLPDGNGHDLIKSFRQRAPRVRCLVLTAVDLPESLFAALEAGARGYLLKDATPAALREAIREVHAGGAPLTPSMARFIVERFAAPEAPVADEAAPRLTEREQQVLELLSRGLTYAEVGGVLDIGIGTVQTHIKRLYRKLAVCSKAEAVSVAHRHGLVDR